MGVQEFPALKKEDTGPFVELWIATREALAETNTKVDGLRADEISAAKSRAHMKKDIAKLVVGVTDVKIQFAGMMGSFKTIKWFLGFILAAMVLPRLTTAMLAFLA